MPLQRFDHYNLCGSRAELDAMRDFYIDVVGLALGPRPPFDRFGYWLYAGPEAVLHLSESAVDGGRAAGAAPETGSQRSFDHAAFACTGLAEFAGKLRQRGIAFRQRSVPLTGLQQLFFTDPCGNGVELNFPAAEA